MATVKEAFPPPRPQPVPHLAGYEVRVIHADDGMVGLIKPLDTDSSERPWQSKPFRTIAAAWRTLLRELQRRQGLD